MTHSLRGTLALLSATFLSAAMYSYPQMFAVALLVPAIVLASMAAIGGDWQIAYPADRLFRVVLRIVVAIGVLFFVASLTELVNLEKPMDFVALLLLSVAIGGSAFGMLADKSGSVASMVFFVVYSIAIGWVLAANPGNDPFIDVIQFQQGAVAAISEGMNPYAVRFLDLYGANSSLFYGVGVSVDGVLSFGFPYPPLSLAVILPFDWLLSDFRVAHAAAIVGAGVLMSRIGRNSQSRGAAAAFLLTAPVLFVLRFGWTEPLVVLLAIGVMYVKVRRRRGISLVTGLLVSAKQYAILFLPSSLLLLERPWRARQVTIHFAKAAGVVALTTLPFLLWDSDAFVRSVIELQFLQPFRADSIAFPAVYASFFGEPSRTVTTIVPLALIGLVTLATLKRTPTGAQGFALASGLTLLVVFAFSKQAFVNYYLVVIALLFGAAAAGGVGANEEDEDVRDPLACNG